MFNAFITGYVSGVAVTICIFSATYFFSDDRDMLQECEKDLARNLKCEMVYAKPSIEGE